MTATAQASGGRQAARWRTLLEVRRERRDEALDQSRSNDAGTAHTIAAATASFAVTRLVSAVIQIGACPFSSEPAAGFSVFNIGAPRMAAPAPVDTPRPPDDAPAPPITGNDP